MLIVAVPIYYNFTLTCYRLEHGKYCTFRYNHYELQNQLILNSYLKVPFHIVCYYKYNLDANSDDAAYHNQMNQMDTDGNA